MPPCWIVTRYEDVKQVERRPDVFSNAGPILRLDSHERLEKLGLGAESAVTLPEVLPRELPEPLHAQLLQVVHRWSEGVFSTPAPPLTRR